ncbi:MAG TPA: DUF2232 domain-containing protein [Candidatus Atribacteria bacterium]|nr:DUF2232 domain-containing protein [Candidatus Atribacteria bacterium]
MDTTQRAMIECLLTGVAAALLLILLSFIPVFSLAVLLFPVPMIITGARNGTLYGLLSLAASAAVISLAVNPEAGIYLLALNVFPVLGLTLAHHKKLSSRETTLISAGGILLSFVLFLTLYSVFAGRSLFDEFWQSVRAFFVDGFIDFKGVLKTYHSMGLFKNFTTEGQLADFLINEMKHYVPYTIIVFSLSIGFVHYLASRYVLKRMGRYVADIPPFDEWLLSRGMGLGFLVLLVVSYFGSRLGIARFDTVLTTITLLVTFIFSVLGLSVVWFFLKAWNLPTPLRLLIIIPGGLLLSLGMGLAIVGMADHLLGLRRVYMNRLKPQE